MNWTCPHCGKTMEVSQEQLAETQGVVVCPQCLSSDTVPGYRQQKSQPATSMNTAKPAPTPPPVKHDDHTQVIKKPARSTTQPPPYRKKISFVEENSNSRSAQSGRATNSQPKKKSKKKKKSRGLLAPHTPWGCLWRTLLYSALLLAIATFVGYVLDTV